MVWAVAVGAVIASTGRAATATAIAARLAIRSPRQPRLLLEPGVPAASWLAVQWLAVQWLAAQWLAAQWLAAQWLATGIALPR